MAVALVGALRAGFEARAQAGGVAPAIARALDQLEAGIGGYAVRQPDRRQPTAATTHAAATPPPTRNPGP